MFLLHILLDTIGRKIHENNFKGTSFKTILFFTINIIFLATNYLLAQTCRDYIPNEWKDSRYVNHDNGTVTDNQTNLMWKKCAHGLSGNDCSTCTGTKHNWEESLQLANQ
jgi:hypothetical protein